MQTDVVVDIVHVSDIVFQRFCQISLSEAIASSLILM